ncbi:hypothetical protein EVAR_85298_1 [Eumeta japonica]|uniref:Reverse transcriptase domain-containing protein n=1 Tax=Eumeta variegata TaxID=151549 RepID=A0A4C1V6W1_EUMVA|nr:hypothetical protein EVAR_85298_1 [Eumeta japonica]
MVTPLDLWISMGGDDHLSSGGSQAHSDSDPALHPDIGTAPQFDSSYALDSNFGSILDLDLGFIFGFKLSRSRFPILLPVPLVISILLPSTFTIVDEAGELLIMERMLVGRLQWHLMPKLQATQYGFTPQRGTEDALYDLITYIYKELNLKKIVLMVSLDIKGAFDNTWWPALKTTSYSPIIAQ